MARKNRPRLDIALEENERLRDLVAAIPRALVEERERAEAHKKRAEQAEARATAAEADNAAMLYALRAMVGVHEGDECYHDHHGLCQGHSLRTVNGKPECEVKLGRDALARTNSGSVLLDRFRRCEYCGKDRTLHPSGNFYECLPCHQQRMGDVEKVRAAEAEVGNDARLAEAGALLRLAEWSRWTSTGIYVVRKCVVCGGLNPDDHPHLVFPGERRGHAPDCRLAAWLSGAPPADPLPAEVRAFIERVGANPGGWFHRDARDLLAHYPKPEVPNA